jgi:transcriptional regulator with XRE-family HTH domain
MASSPDKLLVQIADRTATFLQNTGVSQSRLCRHLSISDSSLSQFLNGTKRLDPGTIIKLCKTLSLTHREVAAKFSDPVRSSKILNLQESVEGRPAQMRLDGSGSWVPGLVGDDPNDSTGIDNTPQASELPEHGHYLDETLDTLRSVRKIHRAAIKVINDFILAAKVNRDGTQTPPTAQKFGARS